MAGIGFELRKLLVGRELGRKVQAYAYAGVLSAGTMMLSFLLLIFVQFLSQRLGIPRQRSEALIVLMIYAMVGSLLLGSGLSMLLTRFVSDQIYAKTTERVLPSLFGGSLVLMAPGGALYALLLSRTVGLSLLDAVLNWVLFMEMLVIWLQMAYITAVKDFRKVLWGFAAGMAVTVVLMLFLLWLGAPFMTAVLCALCVGYGCMMLLYLRALLLHFPPGRGSLLYFLGWVSKYPDYLLIGFFAMAGAYVHMVVMWFGPGGETVLGVLRHAPGHDAASFYAFLVTLPASISFMLSVEVHFYEKYRVYFVAISEHGTLREVAAAREQMVAALWREVVKLSQIQVLFMLAYAVLMRYFLETLGFTREMISTFQMLCVGYSAFAVGNHLVLLLLYFSDRKGAVWINFSFFFLNLFISLWTIHGHSSFNDMGLIVGAGVMYLLAVLRLLDYVKDIDYRVLCGQPVVATPHEDALTRFAGRLDERVLQKEGSGT